MIIIFVIIVIIAIIDIDRVVLVNSCSNKQKINKSLFEYITLCKFDKKQNVLLLTTEKE